MRKRDTKDESQITGLGNVGISGNAFKWSSKCQMGAELGERKRVRERDWASLSMMTELSLEFNWSECLVYNRECYSENSGEESPRQNSRGHLKYKNKI